MQCSHIYLVQKKKKKKKKQRQKKKTRRPYYRPKLNPKQHLLTVTSATKVGNSVFTSHFCESSLLLSLFVSAQRKETTSKHLGIIL